MSTLQSHSHFLHLQQPQQPRFPNTRSEAEMLEGSTSHLPDEPANTAVRIWEKGNAYEHQEKQEYQVQREIVREGGQKSPKSSSLPPLTPPSTWTPPLEDVAMGMQAGRGMLSCSTTPPTLLYSTIIHQTTSLGPVARFHYLLTHASTYVQFHGPYFINENGFLSRGEKPKNSLSRERFASSLAAAQDCLMGIQSEGEAFGDLVVFKTLWETAIYILDYILNSGQLATEPFGWGVFGLSAGYISPCPLFDSHKQSLHKHLVINRPTGSVLTRPMANRRVHTCATMLMQTVKRDWNKVRWYHAVRIAESWIRYLEIKEIKEEDGIIQMA